MFPQDIQLSTLPSSPDELVRNVEKDESTQTPEIKVEDKSPEEPLGEPFIPSSSQATTTLATTGGSQPSNDSPTLNNKLFISIGQINFENSENNMLRMASVSELLRLFKYSIEFNLNF